MQAQVTETTFFKLKNSREYRFYNRAGRRMLNLQRDQILPVSVKADIEYFRARSDVMVECLESGVTLLDDSRVGHLIPGGSKSYRVYGRARSVPRPPDKKPVPPQTLQVGSRLPATIATAPIEESPVEMASPDGSTQPVRPQQDPGR